MSLTTLLQDRKTAIIEEWVGMILETYPKHAKKFYSQQSDQFANPVGAMVRKSASGLYDGLLGEFTDEILGTHLHEMIQLRAVQDFTPAQAVGVILLLKKVIRENVASEIGGECRFDELLALESRIDKLVLFAFDNYMQVRERLFEIKANELKRMSFKLVERLNELGFSGDEQPNGESNS